MRIVSRMAAYTWGTYGNTWPDGFNAPEPPGEDRDLGFITKLPGRTPGKFGRMFVRADASVDAVQHRSNVEDILDAAAMRTSGEVYFEREIGPEGLGRMVPYIDFDINDFVPVRVWGRILPDNLVTEIASVVDNGNVVGYTVHIGGQSWWDLEALRTSNREVDKIIGAERRERGDELAALRAEARDYARTQAELAAQAESENLKVYIDEQDEGVDEAAKGYAKNAESAATTAAGQYTDTTVKPVRDQSNAIDSDIASALALVSGKYGTDISRTPKNRRVTTALDSINTEVDGLNTKHTSLSRKFTTLSNNYTALSNRLDGLNDQYDQKLGTNGTLVESQKDTEETIRQILSGTGDDLAGSNFLSMVTAWSQMQQAFNKQQTGINEGFQDLFGQQSQINAAQDDINEAQAEINRTQGAVNKVQGDINEATAKWQRLAQYAIDSNTALIEHAAATTVRTYTVTDVRTSVRRRGTSGDPIVVARTGDFFLEYLGDGYTWPMRSYRHTQNNPDAFNYVDYPGIYRLRHTNTSALKGTTVLLTWSQSALYESQLGSYYTPTARDASSGSRVFTPYDLHKNTMGFTTLQVGAALARDDVFYRITDITITVIPASFPYIPPDKTKYELE